MRAVVIGTGAAGAASAALLERQGAEVVVTDDATTRLERLPARTDVVVPSPGVPPRHHLVQQALAGGVPVWSEIELAARSWAGSAVAVTGTNGKGSVVTMVADALVRAGHRARAVGNIGFPMGRAVLEEAADCVLVVEVSSFQAQFCSTFSPAAAAVLNATEDHLDWHGSVGAYRAAKGRLLGALRPDAWAVFDRDDPGAAELGAGAAGRKCPYTRAAPGDRGLGVEGGWITAGAQAPGGAGALMPLASLPAPAAPHQVGNAMAVLALARAVDGGATAAAVAAIAAFRGLPHQRQVVAEMGGVTWVDDSKATNPSAAAASISCHRAVVLIAGGRNKGLSFGPVVEAARGRVRAVVGIGESGPEIVAALRAGGVAGEVATDMDDAVARAAVLARRGDTVLLAPACASLDMFPNQAARGEAFAAAVGRAAGAPA